MNNLESIIILNTILDPKPVYLLIEHFGSAQAILQASVQELLASSKVNPKQMEIIANWNKFINLEKEVKRIEQSNTKIIPYWHESYPKQLTEISNAPLLLYIRGKYIPSNEGGVAVVGARSASLYGRKMAKKIANAVANQKIEVISGLARGIDSAAHEGVVETDQGKTFAVLGSGFGYMVSSDNQQLVEKIIEHGAIISEFPWDKYPSKYSFPRRNRIVSGLANVLCVIEASKRSGALITADFALEQGKVIYAMPGQIDSVRSAGCHELIKDGAFLLDNVDDVLKEFNRQTDISSDNKLIELDPIEEKIWRLLEGDCLRVEDIASEIDEKLSIIYKALLKLELKGSIIQMPGKNFTRNIK